jgi:CRISPR-associated exonuclease Cas4
MIDIELKVSDLKQFHYCPRIVFYEYVLPVEKKITYKMEKGKSAQEEIEKLESRRKLKKFGIKEGKRIFNIWIESKKWLLSGKVDMVIETEEEIFPVDFKYTKGKPFKNHLFQLGGYALILEDFYKRPVEKGFVYLIPQKDAIIYELDRSLKEECIKTLREIRLMIFYEKFPDAPLQRVKCADCEYRNYCRDVW